MKKGQRGGRRPGAGRPRKPDDRRITSYSLPSKLIDDIEQAAREEGLPRSEFVARVMARSIRRRKSS